MESVDVVNLGLIVFGALPIDSLTDADVKAARQANKVYEPCRDQCFDYKDIFWNFCTARAELSPLTDDGGDAVTPAFGTYRYYYTLPDNCRKIKLCAATGDDTDYPLRREVYLEGDTVTPVLLCNVDSAYAKYTVMISDPTYWPSWFVHLVAVRIAMYLAEPLKQDTNIQTRIDYLWRQALSEALSADADWGVDTDGNGRDLDRGIDVLNLSSPQSNYRELSR